MLRNICCRSATCCITCAENNIALNRVLFEQFCLTICWTKFVVLERGSKTCCCTCVEQNCVNVPTTFAVTTYWSPFHYKMLFTCCEANLLCTGNGVLVNFFPGLCTITSCRQFSLQYDWKTNLLVMETGLNMLYTCTVQKLETCRDAVQHVYETCQNGYIPSDWLKMHITACVSGYWNDKLK